MWTQKNILNLHRTVCTIPVKNIFFLKAVRRDTKQSWNKVLSTTNSTLSLISLPFLCQGVLISEIIHDCFVLMKSCRHLTGQGSLFEICPSDRKYRYFYFQCYFFFSSMTVLFSNSICCFLWLEDGKQHVIWLTSCRTELRWTGFS